MYFAAHNLKAISIIAIDNLIKKYCNYLYCTSTLGYGIEKNIF
jgi:hypothetical protein